MPKKKTTRKKAATRTTRKKTTTRAATRKAPARKKATTRKTTTRKTTTRAAAPARAKISSADKPRTKSQIFSEIADNTGLSKKEVQSVFESMHEMIEKDLGRRGPGQFTVPGLLKIVKKQVKRRPAQKNKWIPLVQEFRDIPARPAHNKVAVRALKSLKEMV